MGFYTHLARQRGLTRFLLISGGAFSITSNNLSCLLLCSKNLLTLLTVLIMLRTNGSEHELATMLLAPFRTPDTLLSYPCPRKKSQLRPRFLSFLSIYGLVVASPYVGMAQKQDGSSNQCKCVLAFSRRYHRRGTSANV